MGKQARRAPTIPHITVVCTDFGDVLVSEEVADKYLGVIRDRRSSKFREGEKDLIALASAIAKHEWAMGRSDRMEIK